MGGKARRECTVFIYAYISAGQAMRWEEWEEEIR